MARKAAELVLNILMQRDTGRNINQAVGTLGPGVQRKCLSLFRKS